MKSALLFFIFILIDSCSIKIPAKDTERSMDDIRNNNFKSYLTNFTIIDNKDEFIENILEGSLASKKIDKSISSDFIYGEFLNGQSYSLYSGYAIFYNSFVAVFTIINYNYTNFHNKKALLLHTYDYKGRLKDYLIDIVFDENNLNKGAEKLYVSSYSFEFLNNKMIEVIENRLYGSDKTYLDTEEEELKQFSLSFDKAGGIIKKENE